VAKKLAKRAVQRNLVKRIGRDVFRHACASLPPYDLVLRLSAKLDNVTRRMMREDMNSLLGRLPKK
jgi:ribonuclease P protein component